MGSWIELHIHTEVGSHDACLTLEELKQETLRLKLDGLCVTEHLNFEPLINEKLIDAYRSYFLLKEMTKGTNIEVFPGLEVTLGDGSEYLIFGLVVPLEMFNRTWQEAVEQIKKLGGVIVQAHPFRNGKVVSKIVDGVEVFNCASTLKANEECRLWMQKNPHMCCVVGSDAHFVDELGRAIMVFEDELQTNEAFVDAIINGKYTGFVINGQYYEK